MKKWKIEHTRSLISSYFLKVSIEDVRFPHGGTQQYFVTQGPSTVLIIGINDDGKILLVKEYKHGAKHVLWGFPTGMVREHEKNILGEAKREFKEETGMVAEKWEEIGKISLFPHRERSLVYVYVGFNLKKVVDQDLEPSERIECYLFDIQTAKRKLVFQQPINAPALAAFCLFQEKVSYRR